MVRAPVFLSDFFLVKKNNCEQTSSWPTAKSVVPFPSPKGLCHFKSFHCRVSHLHLPHFPQECLLFIVTPPPTHFTLFFFSTRKTMSYRRIAINKTHSSVLKHIFLSSTEQQSALGVWVCETHVKPIPRSRDWNYSFHMLLSMLN